MRTALLLILFAFLLTACAGDGATAWPELDLTTYNVPVTIHAPDSATVVAGKLSGGIDDIIVKSAADRYAVQILAGGAVTNDMTRLKAEELELVRDTATSSVSSPRSRPASSSKTVSTAPPSSVSATSCTGATARSYFRIPSTASTPSTRPRPCTIASNPVSSMEISLILKGMAMGIAEAIPGVSGGTIAFITGIYERLLRAIGSILGTRVAGTFRREGFRPAWREADGAFLLQLGGGMVVGVGIAVVAITYLLEHYPTVVWGFFFGLIISSAIYVGRQITRWGAGTVSLLIAGAVVAYVLTTINPLGGSSSPVLVFFSGMIAISALILPGVSGSFILVLLGMYTVVFGAVRGLPRGEDGALLIVACFGLGCLVGLALFAKLLTWTFKTYPNRTFALLTGFMIGSLNKLWPWRHALTTRTNSSGEEVPVLEANVLPASYAELTGNEPYVLAVLLAIAGGLAIVFLLEASATRKKEEQPTQ